MKSCFAVAVSVAIASEDVMFEEGLSLLQLRAQPHVKAADATDPSCFQTGDGDSSDGETNVGHVNSKQECIDLVESQPADMGCTGATVRPSGTGACYCEKGWYGASGGGWETCGNLVAGGAPAVVEEPADAPAADPSCFQTGDGDSTNGEANVGHVNSKQECIDLVESQPADMGCTGATVRPSGTGACYCEKGWYGASGGGWETCGNLVAGGAPAVVEEPADAPADAADPSCFQAGDGQSSDGEANVGHVSSKQECIDLVKSQPADMGCTGATVRPNGYGACYCEKGWYGASGDGWETCGGLVADEIEAAVEDPLSADTAEAVGDPHMRTNSNQRFDLDLD